MTSEAGPSPEKLQEFITELSGFAQTAEATLSKIQEDLEGNRPLFSIFESRMFAIRGTATQLGLERIADLAGMGEEIANRAQAAATRAHVRKSMGALFDALTTIKFLLENQSVETDEERGILMNRLQATLHSLGGGRPQASRDEIEELLKSRS